MNYHGFSHYVKSHKEFTFFHGNSQVKKTDFFTIIRGTKFHENCQFTRKLHEKFEFMCNLT